MGARDLVKELIGKFDQLIKYVEYVEQVDVDEIQQGFDGKFHEQKYHKDCDLKSAVICSLCYWFYLKAHEMMFSVAVAVDKVVVSIV